MWVLFVVLNGRLTLEIALLGIFVSVLVFFFMCGFMGWSLKRERRLLRALPGLILYVPRLFGWVFAANLSVIRQILSRRAPQSAIVTIRPELKRRWQVQLLANSITLTPGTVSTECSKDRIVVHCLDESMSEGLENSVMEKTIRKMGAEE